MPDPLEWLSAWIVAFAHTQLIEAPIYLLAQRGMDRSVPRRIGVALLPSGLTHPLLWLGLFSWLRLAGTPSPLSWWSVVLVSELAIAGTEGAILRACGVRRPFLWALLANGVSFGIGLLLQALGD